MALGYQAYVRLMATALAACASSGMVGVTAQRHVIGQIGDYQGRGKGKTRRMAHATGQNRPAQRAAHKARNVRRNRAAHRG